MITLSMAFDVLSYHLVLPYITHDNVSTEVNFNLHYPLTKKDPLSRLHISMQITACIIWPPFSSHIPHAPFRSLMTLYGVLAMHA